ALEEQEYREKLTKAGFGAIDLEPTRIYRVEDAREFLAGAGLDGDAIASEVDGKFMSAFVRAQKPTSRGVRGLAVRIRKRGAVTVYSKTWPNRIATSSRTTPPIA